MIREVKTYEIVCDHCRNERAVVHYAGFGTPSAEDLPTGWGTWTTGGWGKTGYSNTEELCPGCFQEAKKKNYGTYAASKRSPLHDLAEQAE